MNILEILREEHIGKKITILNNDEVCNGIYDDEYTVALSEDTKRVGLFREVVPKNKIVPTYYVEEYFNSANIILMDFEFID